jgi:glycosyltransferase involved in cell wall biosynthesis
MSRTACREQAVNQAGMTDGATGPVDVEPAGKGHVAVYVPSLRGGGAERIMVMLTNAFARQGWKVDLVLVEAVGPYLEDVDGSVRLIDLGARRVVTSLPALVRYLRRERPDAMLAALTHTNVVAVAARWLSGVPTRVVVSERNNLSVSRANAEFIRSRAMFPLVCWAYRAADGVTTVSAGVADDLARFTKLPRTKIDVIYNPIVNDELLEKSREQVDHPWFSDNGSPVLLGAGRLVEQKHFSALIHAFARIRKRREARLVILGEGKQRQELEALVRELGVGDDVSLPGFVSNPYAYMRGARVFVLSSAWEGLPGALIQAMACGTPVVSTDCPSGPAEILENGKWGRLVPVGDVEALADAIVATLDDRSSPNVSSRAGAFGVDRAVDEYLRVLFPGSRTGGHGQVEAGHENPAL